MMQDILRSYRETRRHTAKRVKKLKRKADEIKEGMSKKGRGCEVPQTKRELEGELHKIERDIEILNAAISSTTYVITWISTGREPGTIRGIERRAAYELEVPFEGRWLDSLVDQGAIIHELDEQDEEAKEMKKELVRDLKEYLTDRQLEVFIMLGEGIDQAEIAKILGVSRQTVNGIVIRGRRAIREAGWMLV